MPEATAIVIVDGKEYLEGPCLVPGCKYKYQRPKGAYLRLCALHLRRYKARKCLVRVNRYKERQRARREAKLITTLR